MNIIIPLGGKGERFSKNGYNQPKPLIQIFEKCMIEYVIDNLSICSDDKIFIIYNAKLDNYHFTKFITNKYPFIHLIKIGDTKGAVETLFLGIENIVNDFEHHNKCLILDCDTFYTENIRNIFHNSSENMVFYTKNYETNPIYSYIELNETHTIIHIREKEKISDNANTGAYAFVNILTLYDYCKYVLENNITFNNEPYTSCVIHEMIKSNIMFKGHQLKDENMFSLGTPIAVKQYMDKTYAFLFDLDGTIVITDDIYFKVWNEILVKYDFVLTREIFKKYIQGNNDKYVLNILLTNKDITLNELSQLKDDLFIQYIHDVKTIDGVYDVIHQIKNAGHKICIVTNCNKNIANAIVNYIQLDNYVDFVISSTDCMNGKPDVEPYMKAIYKYNIPNDKCIIFEDSKTGILSGKGINPKLLIGIETIYSKSELFHYGVNMSVQNYMNLNIQDLINTELSNINDYLIYMIKQNSVIPNIKEIWMDKTKLKGGFIADVVSYKIVTNENVVYSQVLKYENLEENNLSSMAKKLELYEREYYFYTNISSKVNVCIPKFYNLIANEKNENIGLALENLMDKEYKINLNLNIENIDVTLKIVDRMAKLHSLFWNKNLKQEFTRLKSSNDPVFCPFFKEFIDERFELFKHNWFGIMNSNQQRICNEIYDNFANIQESFSKGKHITFIHGDIKSPNIFYDTQTGNEPYFIDWQHCAIGKGTQDLMFFIIESFDVSNIKSIYHLAKEYYYKKIIEYGILDYSYEEYEQDIYNAVCYIPFFTSVWFGTTPQDELIDKKFPQLFISKLFYLLELIKKA